MKILQKKVYIIYLHRFYRLRPYTDIILVQYKLHTYYGIQKYYVLHVFGYLTTKYRYSYTHLQFWPTRLYYN